MGKYSGRFVDYCFQYGLDNLSVASASPLRSPLKDVCSPTSQPNSDCASVSQNNPALSSPSAAAGLSPSSDPGPHLNTPGTNTPSLSALLTSPASGINESAGFEAESWGNGASTGKHPMDCVYEPTLFSRHPPIDYGTKQDGFPQHLDLFCFPLGGIRMRTIGSQEAIPNPHHHSFVITDEFGVKCHALCFTFYEPLPVSMHATVRAQIEQWTRQQLSAAEAEYVQMIQQKLQAELALAFDDLGEEERTEREERINLYRAQLQPFYKAILEVEEIYVPRVLGVIGRWPFYSVWKDWLGTLGKRLQQGKLHLPIERYIVNLVEEIPLPPPGRLEIRISLDTVQIACSRPPLNCIPVIRNFSYFALFSCLKANDVVHLLEMLVDEQKILLVSTHIAVLNVVSESLVSLLFPFFWQFIYIPILPAALINYIHAPVPFIIGIHPDMLSGVDTPQDVTVVDLDSGNILTSQSLSVRASLVSSTTTSTMSSGAAKPFPEILECKRVLPSKQRKKLLERIAKYCSFQSKSTFTPAVPREFRKDVDSSEDAFLSTGWNTKHQELLQIQKGIIREEVLGFLAKFRQPASSVESFVATKNDSAPTNETGCDQNLCTEKPLPTLPEKAIFSDSDVYGRLSRSPRSSVCVGDITTDKEVVSDDNHEAIIGPVPKVEITANTERSSSKESCGSSPDHRETPIFGGLTTAKDSTDEQVEYLAERNLGKRGKMHFFQQLTGVFETTRLKFREAVQLQDSKTASFSTNENPSTAEIDYPNRAEREAGLHGSASDDMISRQFRLVRRSRFSLASLNSEARSENIHVGMRGPRLEDYALDTKIFSGYIQLMTQVDSTMEVDTHRFVPLYAVLSASALKMLPPKDTCNLQKDLPLGICIGCHKVVRMPVIPSCFFVWSSSGYTAQQVSKKEKKFDLSSAYWCKNCPLLVHAECVDRVHRCYCSGAFNEVKIQSSFFKFWTSVLHNYRPYLDSDLTASEEDSIFKKDAFLAQVRDRDTRDFLARFVKTQAFQQFAHDRVEKAHNEYEILFFDEAIKAKLNRSIVKLNKESTPFLQDPSYSIQEVYECMPPNASLESLPSQNQGKFPTSWVVLPARKVRPLITEKDAMRLRVYTSAIMRKARLEKQQKRQRSHFATWTQRRPSDISTDIQHGKDANSDDHSPRPTRTHSLSSILRGPSFATTQRVQLMIRIDQMFTKLNSIVETAVERDGLEALRVYLPSLQVRRTDGSAMQPSASQAEEAPEENLGEMCKSVLSVVDIERETTRWKSVLHELGSEEPGILKCVTESKKLGCKSGRPSEVDDAQVLRDLWEDLVKHCQSELQSLKPPTGHPISEADWAIAAKDFPLVYHLITDQRLRESWAQVQPTRIFELLSCQWNDEESVEIFCRIMRLLLEDVADPHRFLANSQTMITAGFHYWHADVRILCISFAERLFLDAKADETTTVDSLGTLFPTPLLDGFAMEGSVAVSERIGQFLDKLMRSPFGHFFMSRPETIAKIHDLLHHSSVVRYRVMEAVLPLFSAFSDDLKGDYKQVITMLQAELHSSDIVAQGSAFACLRKTIARGGSSWIYETDILSSVQQALHENPEVSMEWTMRAVYAIQVCGEIAMHDPLIFSQWEDKVSIMRHLNKLRSTGSSEILEALVTTCGMIGSNRHTLAILCDHPFVHTLTETDLRNVDDALKVAKLRAYSVIFAGVASDSSSAAEHLTRRIYSSSGSSGDILLQFLRSAQSMFRNLQLAGIAALRGVMSNAWGREELAACTDFCDYVSQRTGEDSHWQSGSLSRKLF